MAENNRVQLNREEIVGNEVVLSEIAPKTNTESVDDSDKGVKLSQTLEKIWNDINNKLSRVVNSVNGRTGVVVLTAADVNLGNVDDVSFDEIKRWVINRIAQEFSTRKLRLFNNLQDVYDFAQDNGIEYDGTPFYSSHGFTNPEPGQRADYRGYIGYFFANDDSLAVACVALDTVGATDNSIIYNTNVGTGKDFSGGMIGVNIWKYEDALKLYNHASGEASTPGTLEESGLYIDKDKITNNIYVFDNCFGDGTPSDTTALLYLQNSQPVDAKKITFNINDQGIHTDDFLYVRNEYSFKKNDIIVCNFKGDGYYDSDGELLPNIYPEMVRRQAAIGKITYAPTAEHPEYNYVVKMYSIHLNVGNGLKYYTIGDTTELGIDLLTGKAFAPSIGTLTSEDNISGLNTFDSAKVDEHDDPSPSGRNIEQKSVHTMTPLGETAYLNNEKYTTNGLFISPGYSLNVIPYATFSGAESPVDNFPLSTPRYAGNYPNKSFLGVNLVKQLRDNKKAVNLSGLRITDDYESLISNQWLGKNDNDASDKITSPTTSSGGLSVNVGKFLEIGNVGDDITPPSAEEAYWSTGKVNVRTDGRTISDVGYNRLGINISNYKTFNEIDPNVVLGGGLVYTEGYNPTTPSSEPCITQGLTINRGLGLRMSHSDRFGNRPGQYVYNLVEGVDDGQGGLTWPEAGTYYHKVSDTLYEPVVVTGGSGDPYNIPFVENTYYSQEENILEDYGFLSVSIADRHGSMAADDFGLTNESGAILGGLRYMVAPSSLGSQSVIGLRLNDLDVAYGHELRLGSRAIGINENNVVGVQLYRESSSPVDDVNPLNIKGWDEFALFKYVDMPEMKYTVSANTFTDLIAGNLIDIPRSYNYDRVYGSNWPAAGTYYQNINGSYEEFTVTGSGTEQDPYVPTWDSDEKYYTRTETTPDFAAGRADTIYYVKDEAKRYVWDDNLGAYEPMFIYMNHELVDDPTAPGYQAGEINKVYVTQVVDNVEHKIWCRMWQWKEPFRTEIPFSWDPVEGKYDDSLPLIDSVMASRILSYYAAAATTVHNTGYYINGRFYHGASTMTGELSATEGDIYEDLTYPYPHLFYRYYDGAYHTIPVKTGGGNITWEDLLPADVNNNGHIDAVDSSIVLRYYSVMSTPAKYDIFPPEFINDPSNKPRDYFAYYMEHVYNIEQGDDPHYVEMRRTAYSDIPNDPVDGSYIPGLDIDVNEHQGLTTNLNGDIKKSISVKLFDESAGYNITDKYAPLKRGGLRFTTDGFLSVRVNNLNAYNATNLSGRTSSDILTPRYGPNGESTGNEIGVKGLMIYPDNVLGVQLTTNGKLNNGKLMIDEDGCLTISDRYDGGGGGGETLTITDGTRSLEYNGSSPVTLTLGPGLILEITPDPEPEPTPEPNPGE